MTTKPESFTSWTIQGFFQDGRTEAIEGEFGAAGVLFVLKTWDELYRLKSHRMGKLVWFGKAKKYGFDRERAEALLAALSDLEIDYLHVDDAGIGSNAVDAKCEKRSIERENWRDKKRGWKKADDSSPSPDDFQGDSPENGEGFSELSPGESPTPTLTPQPTPQNLNIKNGTSTGAPQVVASAALPEAGWIPAKYQTPVIREYVPKVIQKLRANNRQFGQMEFEALVMRCQCDVKRLEEALIFTASLTKVLNVIEPDDRSRGSPKGPSNLDVLASELAAAGAK